MVTTMIMVMSMATTMTMVMIMITTMIMVMSMATTMIMVMIMIMAMATVMAMAMVANNTVLPWVNCRNGRVHGHLDQVSATLLVSFIPPQPFLILPKQ
jgi:hypothetical protein